MESPIPYIVQKEERVLRERAKDVRLDEIVSPRIQQVLKDMKLALDNEPEGAAIAAPQIGVSLRIFLISERVFGPDSERSEASRDRHFVYINPEVVRRSKRLVQLDEGCLSVRGYYGRIMRHARVTVRAYDEHGKIFTRGASGLLAQAFQHECDHLDGTLFIDTAESVWEVAKNEDDKRPR